MKHQAAMVSVGSTYGGGILYKVVSDFGLTAVDKSLNRQNLPVEQHIKTWIDTAVAIGAAVGAVYFDKDLGAYGTAALTGAGVIAAAQDIEVVEKANHVGAYAKRYAVVNNTNEPPFKQTPQYRPAQGRTSY